MGQAGLYSEARKSLELEVERDAKFCKKGAYHGGISGESREAHRNYVLGLNYALKVLARLTNQEFEEIPTRL